MLYKIQQIILKIIFTITGPIHFTHIYQQNSVNNTKNSFKNITLNYYLNLFIKNYSTGQYFYKTCTMDTTNYYTCIGNIYEVPHIVTTSSVKIKRRDILLFNNDGVINFDLNLLDNFYKNSKTINDNFDINLLAVLKYFSIDTCKSVQFIQLIPFKKQLINASEVKLSELFIQ